MKKIIIPILLILTHVSYGQVKTLKCKGCGSGTDTTTTKIGVHKPLLVLPDSSLAFDSLNLPRLALSFAASLDTASLKDSSLIPKSYLQARLNAIPSGGSGTARIDSVNNSAALSAYSSTANYLYITDSLQGGLFYYTTATNTVDNGVVFQATGKGSGYWVRQYEKAKGVNVDWWGSRDDVGINKATGFAGANGVVNFTANRTYLLSGSIYAKSGQIFNGNNCTVKRLDSVVTLSVAVLTTDNTFTVNKAPKSWANGGQFQIFTDSTYAGQFLTNYMLSISGNTVTVNGTIGTAAAIGTKVRKIFSMIGAQDRFTVRNMIFDGDKKNTAASNTWTVNNTITSGIASTNNITYQSLIEDCQFYNIPNENIMGHGFRVINNYAKNLNGSFIHLSMPYTAGLSPSIPSIIEGNVTDSTNLIATSVTHHSEGVITHSLSSGYTTIVNNRFKNGGTSGSAVFGFINSGTTGGSDLKYSNTIIANNYAENFNKIFYSISPGVSTDSAKTGHLFVQGNTFNNCGTTDWTSYQSGINSYVDTIMVGSNLLVGGTIWKVPVVNSDSLQRYILNNPTATPQKASINVTGDIQINGVSINTATSALPLTGGNLTGNLGVNPTGFGSIQIGKAASIAGYNSANGAVVFSNAYSNGSTIRYLNNGPASYMFVNGGVAIATAPSGTAGNVPTFTNAITVYNNGSIELGGSVGAPPPGLTRIDAFGITAGNFITAPAGGGVLSSRTAAQVLTDIGAQPKGVSDQTTLVAGTKAITVTGVTTASEVQVTQANGSSDALTVKYQAVCTTNTITINAITSAGNNTVNTADISTINYSVTY